MLKLGYLAYMCLCGRIKTFNGQVVRNLRHLVSMVEGCSEEWSIFEFHGTRVRHSLIDYICAGVVRYTCEWMDCTGSWHRNPDT